MKVKDLCTLNHRNFYKNVIFLNEKKENNISAKNSQTSHCSGSHPSENKLKYFHLNKYSL